MYVAEIAMFSYKLLEIDLSPLVPNEVWLDLYQVGSSRATDWVIQI